MTTARGVAPLACCLLAALAAAAAAADKLRCVNSSCNTPPTQPAQPESPTTLFTADPPAVAFLSDEISVLMNAKTGGAGYVYYKGRAYSFQTPSDKAQLAMVGARRPRAAKFLWHDGPEAARCCACGPSPPGRAPARAASMPRSRTAAWVDGLARLLARRSLLRPPARRRATYACLSVPPATARARPPAPRARACDCTRSWQSPTPRSTASPWTCASTRCTPPPPPAPPRRACSRCG